MDKKNLSNIENVDIYENKNRYYFLARLSQTKYYETIEKQRRNAVKIALGRLDKAESDTENAEVVYKTTDYYGSEYECCICWNDPQLNID